MEFPSFDSLYEISDPPPYTQMYGVLDVLDYEDKVGLLRGERHPQQPIQVFVDAGVAREEVIWLFDAAGAIISHRVVDLLRYSGITGWATYPVTVHTRDGQELGNYHGLAVTGRCGPINWERSHPLTALDAPQPYIHCRGCFFDPSTWDGNDIFLWEPFPGFTQFADYPFVTERARVVLGRREVSNIWHRRLTEIEMYVIKDEFTHH